MDEAGNSREVWNNKGFNLQKSALEPNGVMNDCNGVSGFLPQQDIQFLFPLADRLPEGGTLVEIGTWMGLSATLNWDIPAKKT